MSINITQFILLLAIMTGLTVVMGKWLTRVFTGAGHALPERGTYRLLGIDPEESMGWGRYCMALVLSNGVMMLLGYLLLRLQPIMPLNPLGLAAQAPDQAFNTASSFITNTNWQSYSGETSLSQLHPNGGDHLPDDGRRHDRRRRRRRLHSRTEPVKPSRHRQLLG